MDVVVTPEPGDAWALSDLLGRSMGSIELEPSFGFMIRPAGLAVATMSKMSLGPYVSLDAALLAIETHTRGVCRRTVEDPDN